MPISTRISKIKSGDKTKKELESLREFCVSRWPEKMGAIHGVGHWDRVAMFGKMLYQEGADKDVITGDITVNICFDSDRMDLLRVGILPVPERMATKRGAELVGSPNYGDDYDLYVEQAKRGDIQ